MHILKVSDIYLEREFHKFPARLYRQNNFWIQAKPEEVERIFNTENNTFLENGKACRWILQNFRGATIGRIAAFVDRRGETDIGCLGLFECIDHQQAALKLLEEGAFWLKEQGISTIHAPVNPTSLFLKSGLLTEGFDDSPVYGSSYHPAYYQGFFEAYGFSKHFRQCTYRHDLSTVSLPDTVQERAKVVLGNQDYQIKPFQKEQLSEMARHMALVYNQAWQHLPTYYELSEHQIKVELEQLEPWIDERVFLLAYYQNQPIGFFFNLPDINQIRKLVKEGVFRKMREAYLRKGKHKHLLSVLLGVIPEFQRKGVASAMISRLIDQLHRPELHYERVETNRIGDDLAVVHRLVRPLAGENHQQYWVYHKHLNSNEPIVPVSKEHSEITK